MDEPQREASREIAIRVESGTPMQGSIKAGNAGRRVRFVGWLSLLAALERLFDEPRRPNSSKGGRNEVL